MLTANDVAGVIIARNGTWLDAMSLQKLLYYVQAWHVAITDEPLFDEQIKAWKDGPVVPQVWHARRDRASRRAATQNIENIHLDDLASNLVDMVVHTYGSISGEELSALTHAETPWIEARGALPADAECRTPISLDSMARFYRSHRRLGGRTAADLAAGGIHIRATEAVRRVDVDELLDSLGDEGMDAGDDPWGGGNLQDSSRLDAEGIEHESRRSYADR